MSEVKASEVRKVLDKLTPLWTLRLALQRDMQMVESQLSDTMSQIGLLEDELRDAAGFQRFAGAGRASFSGSPRAYHYDGKIITIDQKMVKAVEVQDA